MRPEKSKEVENLVLGMQKNGYIRFDMFRKTLGKCRWSKRDCKKVSTLATNVGNLSIHDLTLRSSILTAVVNAAFDKDWFKSINHIRCPMDGDGEWETLFRSLSTSANLRGWQMINVERSNEPIDLLNIMCACICCENIELYSLTRPISFTRETIDMLCVYQGYCKQPLKLFRICGNIDSRFGVQDVTRLIVVIAQMHSAYNTTITKRTAATYDDWSQNDDVVINISFSDQNSRETFRQGIVASNAIIFNYSPDLDCIVCILNKVRTSVYFLPTLLPTNTRATLAANIKN